MMSTVHSLCIKLCVKGHVIGSKVTRDNSPLDHTGHAAELRSHSVAAFPLVVSPTTTSFSLHVCSQRVDCRADAMTQLGNDLLKNTPGSLQNLYLSVV